MLSDTNTDFQVTIVSLSSNFVLFKPFIYGIQEVNFKSLYVGFGKVMRVYFLFKYDILSEIFFIIKRWSKIQSIVKNE